MTPSRGGEESRLAEDANGLEGTGKGTSGSLTAGPLVTLRWRQGQGG